MRYPLDRMRIRQFQGNAYRPLSNTFGMVRVRNSRPKAHQGWDLEATSGTPVYAIAYGQAIVVSSDPSTPSGWGHYIRLQFLFKGATYYAFYAHLGQHLVGHCCVVEGAIIALTGMTGNATSLSPAEAHLHFGIATQPNPGRGLTDYIDPGEIFGYEIYSCSEQELVAGTRPSWI